MLIVYLPVVIGDGEGVVVLFGGVGQRRSLVLIVGLQPHRHRDARQRPSGEWVLQRYVVRHAGSGEKEVERRIQFWN